MILANISEKTGYPRSLRITQPNLFGQMYSYKENGIPVNSGKLFEQLAADWLYAIKGNYNFEISDLFIDTSDILKIDSDKRLLCKVTSVDELLKLDHEEIAVKRAIGKIKLTGIHEHFSPSLAVNISEKGFELAFGENVNICSYEKVKGAGGNFTKLSLKEIRQILKQKMATTMETLETDLALIQSMEQQTVTKSQWQSFLGFQFTKIERANHYRVSRAISALSEEEKSLAVNGRQLARIAVEATQPSHEIYNWNDDVTASLWAITNWGTERLKFEQGSDSLTVLRSNRDWVNLVSHFPFSRS